MNLSPDLVEFRDQVRDFIRTSLPEDIRSMAAEERVDLPKEAQVRWHRILETRGWGCPGWPVEHGGPGWSDAQLYIFEREIALADAPRPMLFGTGMLGPTIMAYGSDRQQAEVLPRIRTADDVWCQGYSDPGAGSDLASLKCRAERRGDHYLVNGTKIWTTDAHIADRMFGLFRTDSSGKKQYGITFLLLDMDARGVSVTPIKTFDGAGAEVNQVFFDDVEVPVANRVGEENQGWGIAKYLLSLERVKDFAATHVRGNRALLEDPEFAARIGNLEITLCAVELTELRMLFGSEPAGAEASLLKLRGTEVQNDILQLLHDAVGRYALVAPEQGRDGNRPPGEPGEARYAARAHFNFRKTMIYSGSNEIQRNILAKVVLGL